MKCISQSLRWYAFENFRKGLIPNFPPFGGQGTIDSYLAKFLDPVTRKVKLAENQVIFLYELGTTDTSSTAYDMQDLVVLATIAPSSN
jgi:hypothetical protein